MVGGVALVVFFSVGSRSIPSDDVSQSIATKPTTFHQHSDLLFESELENVDLPPLPKVAFTFANPPDPP
jgi:hypothetical protein